MSRVLSRVTLAIVTFCLLGTVVPAYAVDEILRPSPETKDTDSANENTILPRNDAATQPRSQDFDGLAVDTPAANPIADPVTSTPTRSPREITSITQRGGDIAYDRPPEPLQKPSNNLYPQDFLTMSTPSTEPPPAESSPDTAESVPEEDSHVFSATLLGLLIFGIFTWSDYRYRQILQSLLAKNRRILGGEIVDSSSETITSPWGSVFSSDNWFPWFRPARSNVDLNTQIALLNDDPKL